MTLDNDEVEEQLGQRVEAQNIGRLLYPLLRRQSEQECKRVIGTENQCNSSKEREKKRYKLVTWISNSENKTNA